MKTNQKEIDLLKIGFSVKTLSSLTESQINSLYRKMIQSEQVKKEKVVKTTIPASNARTGVNVNGTSVQMTQNGDIVTTQPTESEMSEAKKKKTNPWAICTAQMGDEFGTTERSKWTKAQKNKYERCVKDVKKQIKENKDSVSLFLEKKISQIVEKHIPPRMTKKDLLSYVSEQAAPTTAPPKTKPDTKPGKPGTKPKRPPNPFRNPNPGEQPAPKAQDAPTTAPPKTKPGIKPGKPGTTPKRPPSPFKNPNPGEQPAPKAQKPSREDAKDKLINLIKNILEK